MSRMPSVRGAEWREMFSAYADGLKRPCCNWLSVTNTVSLHVESILCGLPFLITLQRILFITVKRLTPR